MRMRGEMQEKWGEREGGRENTARKLLKSCRRGIWSKKRDGGDRRTEGGGKKGEEGEYPT